MHLDLCQLEPLFFLQAFSRQIKCHARQILAQVQSLTQTEPVLTNQMESDSDEMAPLRLGILPASTKYGTTSYYCNVLAVCVTLLV